ncbi:MAG TPA: hypothetical protein PLQ57_12500 [Saprospiraceae bacterium]|nr:hypothetical protein [Saprospiraceae bacterium]
MIKRKRTIEKTLLIAFCLFINLVYGQKAGCYNFFEFEKFLTTYTIDPESYKKEFSENLRYPAICRENNLEGDLEFLVLYHGDASFEIIQKNLKEHNYFEGAVKSAFEKVKGKLRPEMKDKMMTLIRIRFDIEPLEENHEFNYDFIKTAAQVKIKTETSHHQKNELFERTGQTNHIRH